MMSGLDQMTSGTNNYRVIPRLISHDQQLQSTTTQAKQNYKSIGFPNTNNEIDEKKQKQVECICATNPFWGNIFVSFPYIYSRALENLSVRIAISKKTTINIGLGWYYGAKASHEVNYTNV
uniref:DUF4421 domain-containing protein n=1 Tax=Brugia pahangi TaxID=6280 RepID=A0A0N4TLM6_BRUPA